MVLLDIIVHVNIIIVKMIITTESFDNLKDRINSIKQIMEAKNIFLPLIIFGNYVDLEESWEISKEDEIC